MYIIVSAAHPRHCQPACILPVSKLPGTWREKLRAITEPPLRGGVWSLSAAARFSLHGDSALTSGMLLTPFNVHFQIQNVSFHVANCFQWSRGQLLSQKENTQRTLAVFLFLSFFFLPSTRESWSCLTLRFTIKRVISYRVKTIWLLWGKAKNYPC